MVKSAIQLLTTIFLLVCLFAAGSALAAPPESTQALPKITMHQNPNCGCCHKWAEHLKAEGFAVDIKPTRNMNAVKQQLGIPVGLASCHTATVDGYVIEGHVPASDIKRLLKEKPDVAGLTAPGMPRHSPGMQPPGEKPRGYDVLSYDKHGKTAVFTSYR